MTRVADGDREAFEEIYRRHRPRALMQARKLCASRELAEEVTQETFIALWRGAHLYRAGRGSVGAWLAGMVRNRSIDAWRRAAVRPVEVQAYDDGHGELRSSAGDDVHDPERAAVLSLMAELPIGQREAIFLSFFGGMTHSEIAARTDVPLGTIKSRIRVGLERLRDGFEQPLRAPLAQPVGTWPALRLVPAPDVADEPGVPALRADELARTG